MGSQRHPQGTPHRHPQDIRRHTPQKTPPKIYVEMFLQGIVENGSTDEFIAECIFARKKNWVENVDKSNKKYNVRQIQI